MAFAHKAKRNLKDEAGKGEGRFAKTMTERMAVPKKKHITTRFQRMARRK